MITLVAVSPSLLEMATQDLSPLVVLARVVGAFALVSLLVIAASALLLRYVELSDEGENPLDQE